MVSLCGFRGTYEFSYSKVVHVSNLQAAPINRATCFEQLAPDLDILGKVYPTLSTAFGDLRVDVGTWVSSDIFRENNTGSGRTHRWPEIGDFTSSL